MKQLFKPKKGKKNGGEAKADAPVKSKPRARKEKGAGAGLPPFLSASAEPQTFRQKVKVTQRPKAAAPADAREQEADRASENVGRTKGPSGFTVTQAAGGAGGRESFEGETVERRLGGARSGGEPLPAATRELMERKFGADFAGVRVHADTQAARSADALGANAFTKGRDIYFAGGRYDPASSEGRGLLAHELAHVLQQEKAGAAGPVQCQPNLQRSMPTTLGTFDIAMTAQTVPRVGVSGTITFHPDPSGPYSAQIGMIQVVNLTDVSGSSRDPSGNPTPPGSPWDWSGGTESGRMDLMTTGAGLGTAPRGWFVDTQTAAHARDSSVGPNYIEQWGLSPRNVFGWLRSPTDLHETSLWDYPSTHGPDLDFQFETVVKATDTQAIYGAIHWGFGIRSGAVVNDYSYVVDAQSATFDEALERFRGYYTHEPVVIYFDTDSDIPLPGEGAKIARVLDYLDRYPDVRLNIDGYADERGSEAHNLDLSLRRGQSVEALAVVLGVSQSRINLVLGHGRTAAFAAGADAGTWRANRRVVITFERTATTPIRMP